MWNGVSRGWRPVLLACACAAMAAAARAEDTAPAAGTIEGRVVDTKGAGVAGVEVRLEGDEGARRVRSADPDGAFRFEGLAPASYRLSGVLNGRRQSREAVVTLSAGGAERVELQLELGFAEEVTVSQTREEQLKRETAATVDTVSRETIERIKPTHPGQVMAQVPGVWVNVTGGEGHVTSIRQPLTTNPVYLYLEDGVPSRSTGFFNHNALYEINVPKAQGIEVTKGPGSALYGSDAIGGVVNVITRPALGPPGLELDAEGGAHGWRRVMGGGQLGRSGDGLRADVNLTRTDGWREATGYDRQAFTLRWDHARGSGSFLKTLVSYSNIDQETAGSSTLQEDDYRARPTRNLTPISFRAVAALRFSADYARESGDTLLSFIPFFRYDRMDLLPNWALTFDPTVYYTSNTSYGLLAKVRRNFAPLRAQVVAGLDFDLSPGGRRELAIVPGTTRTDNGKTVFTSYTDGPVVYDYDVTYLGLAPYLSAELSPTPRLRASAGVRFDHMRYDYDDLLTTPATPRYRRPEDAVRSYEKLSPKLGLTYQFTDALNAFASYRHAFRAPSEGQLFRQGSTLNTIDLKPVKAESAEVGLRARPWRGLSLEVSAYQLDKEDDILSYRDPRDGATQSLNAGRTRHRGLEWGLHLDPARWVQVSAGLGLSRHTYEDWVVDPARGVDYSGKVMETAPRQVGNLLLAFTPRPGSHLSAEVVYVGRYWMDAANTQEYPGHTLLNLRAEVRVHPRLVAFARVLNAADRRYAESSSFTLARGREFAPGLPRTAYAGLKLEWER